MGTSAVGLRDAFSIWDHPHAYGDKVLKYYIKISIDGSSPRVWGQECQAFQTCIRYGIIPTRMGTRLESVSVENPQWDHPHAYGDKPQGR